MDRQKKKGKEGGSAVLGVGPGPAGRPVPAEAAAKTDNGGENGSGADVAAGLVCVAAGPGWSYWFPRAEWEGLSNAKRRRIKRQAVKRYAAELVEEDVTDPYAELVDQEPPDWRDWREY